MLFSSLARNAESTKRNFLIESSIFIFTEVKVTKYFQLHALLMRALLSRILMLTRRVSQQCDTIEVDTDVMTPVEIADK